MNPTSTPIKSDGKECTGHAFIELWEFIESQGLDLMTENDMKCALVVLGEAGQLPDPLVHGSAGDEEEVEAMFFIRNKCGGDDDGNV